MGTLMHPTFVHTIDESDKRYIKDTTNLRLLLKKSNEHKLATFYDANYARDRIERKNTSGVYHFIGANLVSWSSKRQGTIAMSTVKVEYFCYCVTHNFNEYKLAGFYDVDYARDKIERKSTSRVYHFIEANLVSWSSKKQGTIAICYHLPKNLILHSIVKYIKIKHHFIRDYVQKGIFNLEFVRVQVVVDIGSISKVIGCKHQGNIPFKGRETMLGGDDLFGYKQYVFGKTNINQMNLSIQLRLLEIVVEDEKPLVDEEVSEALSKGQSKEQSSNEASSMTTTKSSTKKRKIIFSNDVESDDKAPYPQD
ncbi:putative mitochondrial protein, partial [Mucuna pruriens]